MPSRHFKHPDREVERLLEQLERQGVDQLVIEQFAQRAAIRTRAHDEHAKALAVELAADLKLI